GRRVHTVEGPAGAYDPTADSVVTPVVAQLTDDNEDGRIDERDDVDILWQWLQPWEDSSVEPHVPGGTRHLQIVDGRTFAVQASSPPSVSVWGSSCTVADLDGDGIPEVLSLTGTESAKVVTAFDNEL